MRTAHQIAATVERLPFGPQAIGRINNFFRRQDESGLPPIWGKFNATERAIRRLRRKRAAGLICETQLEYAEALDYELSNIVNSQ